MRRIGIDGVLEDLRAQGEFVRETVPVYHALLALLGEVLPGSPTADRLAALWAGRTFFAGYERPLLILGSLRYDALREGPAHPLWRALAVASPDPSAATRPALEAALAPDRERFWSAVSERALQTNETSRAIAWLWPAHLWWRADPDAPLALVDVGTSAGLNLVADGLPSPWTDAAGQPVPVAPLPPVAQRIGLDASPLDVLDPDAATWLEACVWPGQAARLARLEHAIERFRQVAGSSDAPRLERCSIEDVPERVAAVEAPRVLALQTVVRGYLSEQQRADYASGMRRWLSRRPTATALWVELEVVAHPDDPGRAAVLTASMRTAQHGVMSFDLARTHPHPQRLFIEHARLDAFTRELRGAK